ncbi:hypothetical protein [Terrabacter lapilli]
MPRLLATLRASWPVAGTVVTGAIAATQLTGCVSHPSAGTVYEKRCEEADRRGPCQDVAVRHTAPVSQERATMKWFTFAFHDGRLPDRAQDVVIRDYRRHLRDLRRTALVLRALAELNLHDAQVQRWHLTDAQFRWSLLIGDLESGYQLVDISYRAASLVGIDARALVAAQLDTSADAELVSDELDALDDGRFEHRFRFWPELEFGVAFGQVDVTLLSASSQDRRMS